MREGRAAVVGALLSLLCALFGGKTPFFTFRSLAVVKLCSCGIGETAAGFQGPGFDLETLQVAIVCK